MDILYRSLKKHGFDAAALHGDMAQSARTETLGKFKAGEIKLVVCSDVAARGIDIIELSHVFNFDIPTHAEDYVHRIGRTGRAGREGRAFTLVTPEDGKYLHAIERLQGRRIEEIHCRPRQAGSRGGARETGRRRAGKERFRRARSAKKSGQKSAKKSAGPKRDGKQDSRPEDKQDGQA